MASKVRAEQGGGMPHSPGHARTATRKSFSITTHGLNGAGGPRGSMDLTASPMHMPPPSPNAAGRALGRVMLLLYLELASAANLQSIFGCMCTDDNHCVPLTHRSPFIAVDGACRLCSLISNSSRWYLELQSSGITTAATIASFAFSSSLQSSSRIPVPNHWQL